MYWLNIYKNITTFLVFKWKYLIKLKLKLIFIYLLFNLLNNVTLFNNIFG